METMTECGQQHQVKEALEAAAESSAGFAKEFSHWPVSGVFPPIFERGTK
jgi:hypothetical protein